MAQRVDLVISLVAGLVAALLVAPLPAGITWQVRVESSDAQNRREFAVLIRNQAQETFEVYGIRSSCDCVVLAGEQKTTRLKPGDEIRVLGWIQAPVPASVVPGVNVNLDRSHRKVVFIPLLRAGDN